MNDCGRLSRLKGIFKNFYGTEFPVSNCVIELAANMNFNGFETNFTLAVKIAANFLK